MGTSREASTSSGQNLHKYTIRKGLWAESQLISWSQKYCANITATKTQIQLLANTSCTGQASKHACSLPYLETQKKGAARKRKERSGSQTRSWNVWKLSPWAKENAEFWENVTSWDPVKTTLLKYFWWFWCPLQDLTLYSWSLNDILKWCLPLPEHHFITKIIELMKWQMSRKLEKPWILPEGPPGRERWRRVLRTTSLHFLLRSCAPKCLKIVS